MTVGKLKTSDSYSSLVTHTIVLRGVVGHVTPNCNIFGSEKHIPMYFCRLVLMCVLCTRGILGLPKLADLEADVKDGWTWGTPHQFPPVVTMVNIQYGSMVVAVSITD